MVLTTTTSGDAAASASLLDVRALGVSFGSIQALQEVSFVVRRGHIVGLIGPNGAGKTTLFNCLSLLYRPSSGDILFNGRSLLAAKRHRIAALGIGRTFQNVSLFDTMTVEENVLVGGHIRATSGFASNVLKLASARAEERLIHGRADMLMGFMGLDQSRGRLTADIPFPIRKRVELARALMTEPQLLLLDEPAAGLNHEEVCRLEDQIRQVRDEFKVTVLLVEHHMNLVMAVSDHIVALDFGRKIADGTPDEVKREPRLIQAYLGADA